MKEVDTKGKGSYEQHYFTWYGHVPDCDSPFLPHLNGAVNAGGGQ